MTLQRQCGDMSMKQSLKSKPGNRSEEHTSELQSHVNLVCRLLLEKKKTFLGRSGPSAASRMSHRRRPPCHKHRCLYSDYVPNAAPIHIALPEQLQTSALSRHVSIQ